MDKSLESVDQAYVWHPFTSLVNTTPPLLIDAAKGVKLITPEGTEIIDAVSSWWVNIHGHAHPVLAKAIYDQALKMEHVIFAGFTHAPAIHLAEKLVGILPGKQQKIFFSD